MRLAQDGREIGQARVVLSEGYFGPPSNVLGAPLGARIASLMTATSIDWPEIAFAPRSASALASLTISFEPPNAFWSRLMSRATNRI